MPFLSRRDFVAGLPYLGGCLGVNKSSSSPQPMKCKQSLTDEEWDSFQSDTKNTGVTPQNLSPSPKFSWKLDVGDRDGGAIVSDGIIYVGTDKPASYTLDGREQWGVDTESPVQYTPSIGCGLALFPTIDSVVAVDFKRGTKRWTQQLGVIRSPVLIHRKNYTVCASQTLYRGSLVDGSIKWKFTGSGLKKRGVCASNKQVFVVAGENSEGSLHALGLDSGKVHWSTEIDGEPLCQPVVSGKSVITITSAGSIIALDSNDGSSHWESPAPDTRTPTPAVSDTTVYVSSGNSNHLTARNISDGIVRWTTETGPTLAPPVVGTDTVLVGTMNRGLNAFSSSGDIRWQLSVGGVGSPLCITSNLLLFKEARTTSLNAYSW